MHKMSNHTVLDTDKVICPIKIFHEKHIDYNSHSAKYESPNHAVQEHYVKTKR